MSQYNRVIIEGRGMIGEVWSCGLNYQGAGSISDFDDLQAWSLAIADFIELAPGTGIYGIISSQAAITGVRTEWRGHAEELLQAGETLLTPEKTGVNSPDKVPQASCCFSLLTGRPGRSYRGRIYWPAWVWSSAGQMRFSAGNLTTWLGQVKALNAAILSAADVVQPGYLGELVVRSRLLHTSQPVTQLLAGDVPDVQRRRRDAMPEVYQTTVIP